MVLKTREMFLSTKSILVLRTLFVFVALAEITVKGEPEPHPVFEQEWGRLQMIKIYEDSSCEESSLLETITQPHWVSPVLSDFLDSEVYLLVNGLWRITQYADETLYYGNYPYDDEDGADDNDTVTQCTSLHVSNSTVSFERLGDQNQSLEGLRFFPYKGLPSSSLNSLVRGNFSHWAESWRNVTLESFFFVGNVSWGVYSEEDYQGEEVCLRPFPIVIQQGYGITYDLDVHVHISSVRTVCREDMGVEDPEDSTTEDEGDDTIGTETETTVTHTLTKSATDGAGAGAGGVSPTMIRGTPMSMSALFMTVMVLIWIFHV